MLYRGSLFRLPFSAKTCSSCEKHCKVCRSEMARITRLISKDEDMYISFVYLPPEGSDYSNSDSFSEIETLLLPYFDSSKYLYIMGDINARTGNYAEHTEFDLDQIATEQSSVTFALRRVYDARTMSKSPFPCSLRRATLQSSYGFTGIVASTILFNSAQ